MRTAFKTPVRTAATTLVGLSTIAAIAYGASCGAYNDCSEMPSELSTFMANNFLSTNQAMNAAQTFSSDEIYALASASVATGSAIISGTVHAIGRSIFACLAKKDAAADALAGLEAGDDRRLDQPLIRNN